MLTSWIFIAVCDFLLYWFHPGGTCCLPVGAHLVYWKIQFRKQALNRMLKVLQTTVVKRLLEISDCFKPFDVGWLCGTVCCFVLCMFLSLSPCLPTTIMFCWSCYTGKLKMQSSGCSGLWGGSCSQWLSQRTGNHIIGLGLTRDGTGGVPRMVCVAVWFPIFKNLYHISLTHPVMKFVKSLPAFLVFAQTKQNNLF